MTDKTTMTISRRDLFTAGGACGIAAMQPACAALVGQDEAALKAFHATCSMECLHCYLKAYVKDGKIVRIESDNGHEGKGCARGLSRIKWVYAENRIRTPLKRVGKSREQSADRMLRTEFSDCLPERTSSYLEPGPNRCRQCACRRLPAA